MKIWITSDLHLGHNNIRKYCARTRGNFTDVQDMNNSMVQAWNEHVSDHDLVYILGDVSFMSPESTVEILQTMQGKKILIEGNHDHNLLKNSTFRSCFASIHSYLKLKYQDHKIIMFHYPILRWDSMHYGSFLFHGHCHGDPTGLEELRCMDVGYDATGKIVISLDDAISSVKDRKLVGHH